MQAVDPAPEGHSWNATVSDLHVTLAKKNAEVENLRSSLSIMQASSQKPPWQAPKVVHDAETVAKAQLCVSTSASLLSRADAPHLCTLSQPSCQGRECMLAEQFQQSRCFAIVTYYSCVSHSLWLKVCQDA